MPFDAPHGVNVTECLALAEFLEKLPAEQFDMRSYANVEPCGTTACMAGWCTLMHGGEIEGTEDAEVRAPNGLLAHEFAEQKLGLHPAWADKLFLNMSPKSPVQAARVLRHLAATGEVDWGVAGEP